MAGSIEWTTVLTAKRSAEQQQQQQQDQQRFVKRIEIVVQEIE